MYNCHIVLLSKRFVRLAYNSDFLSIATYLALFRKKKFKCKNYQCKKSLFKITAVIEGFATVKNNRKTLCLIVCGSLSFFETAYSNSVYCL